MENIRKIFDNIKINLSLKLISLVLAFFAWVIIMSMVKPIISDHVNVPIDIENEEVVDSIDKSYIINGTKTCEIKYIVSAEDANTIRQSDFKVYVDLNELMSTENLTVQYKLLNNIDKLISNVEINPKTIKVQLADLSRQDFRVKYNVNGNMSDGLTVGNVILSPTRVFISANENIINSISHVEIDIPLNNSSDSFSGVANAKIIDKDGKVLNDSSIEISEDEIKYTVSAFASKSINVNAVVEGNVKKGYSYAGVQIYPTTLTVSGPRSTMDTFFSLDLPVIDIEGLSENTYKVYKVADILPAGFKCNSVNEIIVNVMINDNIINRPNITTDVNGPHVSVNIEEKIKTEDSSGE